MSVEERSTKVGVGVAGAQEDQREHPRTRQYGPQELLVCYGGESSTHTIKTVLWDFSEGGVGMESSEPLAVDEEVTISGELHNPSYSVAFRSRARVAYCREINKELYRIGAAFREVSYRRLADETVTNPGTSEGEAE